MNVQKDCEVIEQLLERDLTKGFLNPSEFHSLNKILLVLSIDGKYNQPKETTK